jgi:integration host factor subunit alpha
MRGVVVAGCTITRADLNKAVREEVGLSKLDSARLVDEVLEIMSAALVEEEEVKLSSFGNFLVRQKEARIGRNPKTGVEMMIIPHKVLNFRASILLKTIVDQKLNASG